MALLENTEYNILELCKKLQTNQLFYESANKAYIIQLSTKYCAKMLWIMIETNHASIELTQERGDLCDLQTCEYIFNTKITQIMLRILKKRLKLKPKILNL